jgi:hypothetical protein
MPNCWRSSIVAGQRQVQRCGTPQGEVYVTDVSRQTISTITDKVVEGMAEWQNRPLDPVYPVIFIGLPVRREPGPRHPSRGHAVRPVW